MVIEVPNRLNKNVHIFVKNVIFFLRIYVKLQIGFHSRGRTEITSRAPPNEYLGHNKGN